MKTSVADSEDREIRTQGDGGMLGLGFEELCVFIFMMGIVRAHCILKG